MHVATAAQNHTSIKNKERMVLPQSPKAQFSQTPGLVLSLRVEFVLPLSQEEEEEQQQEPSPKSIILPTHTKLLKGF